MKTGKKACNRCKQRDRACQTREELLGFCKPILMSVKRLLRKLLLEKQPSWQKQNTPFCFKRPILPALSVMHVLHDRFQSTLGLCDHDTVQTTTSWATVVAHLDRVGNNRFCVVSVRPYSSALTLRDCVVISGLLAPGIILPSFLWLSFADVTWKCRFGQSSPFPNHSIRNNCSRQKTRY